MIPAIYWWRIGGTIAVLLGAWWLLSTINGWRKDSNQLEATETALETATTQYAADLQAYADQHDKDVEQASKDAETTKVAVAESTRIKLERDQLLERVIALRAAGHLTVERPNADPQKCPTVRLSPDVRMCFNAATEGRPEACAAADTGAVRTSM
jgi:hypothetical protein